MFSGAAAFTDNTFFCSGLWMYSPLRATDFTDATLQLASGVTDFSCGGVLRTMNIKLVVNEWIGAMATQDTAKRSSIVSKHGLIQDWNTSGVTSMYQLFYYKTTFNADLSKWNVARVTDMGYSMFHFPLFLLSLSLHEIKIK